MSLPNPQRDRSSDDDDDARAVFRMRFCVFSVALGAFEDDRSTFRCVAIDV